MNHTLKPKKSKPKKLKNPIIPADKDCPIFWPGYRWDMETLYAIGFALNSFETFLVARDETYGDKHWNIAFNEFLFSCLYNASYRTDPETLACGAREQILTGMSEAVGKPQK